MSFLPIGPHDPPRSVPVCGPLYSSAPVMTLYSPSTTAYVKVAPSAASILLEAAPIVTTETLQYASLIVHKVADANGIAATNPAITDANTRALITELKADYDTHIAATAYHDVAGTNTTGLADATDESTTVALANRVGARFLVHFADTTVHGGKTDVVNLAATVAALLAPATNYATALTLTNALAVAWLAHCAVTDVGLYMTHAVANMPLPWPCTAPFWCKTNVSGHTFATKEFRS